MTMYEHTRVGECDNAGVCVEQSPPEVFDPDPEGGDDPHAGDNNTTGTASRLRQATDYLHPGRHQRHLTDTRPRQVGHCTSCNRAPGVALGPSMEC